MSDEEIKFLFDIGNYYDVCVETFPDGRKVLAVGDNGGTERIGITDHLYEALLRFSKILEEDDSLDTPPPT